jgi:hypothetical protein
MIRYADTGATTRASAAPEMGKARSDELSGDATPAGESANPPDCRLRLRNHRVLNGLKMSPIHFTLPD